MKLTEITGSLKKQIGQANKRLQVALDAAKDEARDLVRNELRSVIKKTGSKLPNNIVASRKSSDIDIYGRGMHNVKKFEFFLTGRKSYIVRPKERRALVFKSRRKKTFKEDHPGIKYKSTRTATRLSNTDGVQTRSVFTRIARHKPLAARLPDIASKVTSTVSKVFSSHGFSFKGIKTKVIR